LFKVTTDAADKGKAYSRPICSTPELSERNVCDGLEIKFTSPLGEIQQIGGSETSAKSATPCYTFG